VFSPVVAVLLHGLYFAHLIVSPVDAWVAAVGLRDLDMIA